MAHDSIGSRRATAMQHPEYGEPEYEPVQPLIEMLADIGFLYI